MIDRGLLREEPEAVRRAVETKGVDVDLDRVIELDEQWRELKARGDDLRHERNEVSDRIGELKAQGEEGAAEAAIERSRELKAELETVEERAEDIETELEAAMLRVPNVPKEDVPVGEDEEDNVEVRREGFEELRELPEEVVPHYDLGEELEILDFERGAKVSGGGEQSGSGRARE